MLTSDWKDTMIIVDNPHPMDMDYLENEIKMCSRKIKSEAHKLCTNLRCAEGRKRGEF